MSQPRTQHLKNHARYVPLYHFVVLPILVANAINSIVLVTKLFNWATVLDLLVAIALVLLGLSGRAFANTVQDRVIRLEEQLRFERLLPADLRARIHEFTREQFVALRFASDAELPLLAREVLDQRIHDRGAIKQMVKEWRADHLRA